MHNDKDIFFTTKSSGIAISVHVPMPCLAGHSWIQAAREMWIGLAKGLCNHDPGSCQAQKWRLAILVLGVVPNAKNCGANTNVGAAHGNLHGHSRRVRITTHMRAGTWTFSRAAHRTLKVTRHAHAKLNITFGNTKIQADARPALFKALDGATSTS